MSALESQLVLLLSEEGIPEPVREYRFAAEIVGLGPGVRKRLQDENLKDWRFDFAWPEKMLAVEVEGGGWTGGRHTRGYGFADDLKKYNMAMFHGWNVYRCDASLIKSGDAVNTIKKLYHLK